MVVTATEIKSESAPEPETEAQEFPHVVVMSLEGPVPTLGGRAQAAYRRAHDQLRAFGLNPDQVLGPPDPANRPATLAELTEFLKGPLVAEMKRDQQLPAARRWFGHVSRAQFREACKIVDPRKGGRGGPRGQHRK